MKFFVAILTFYTICLIASPCVDGITSAENQIAVQNHQHDQKNNTHHDACSPFCVCSCCSIVVVVSEIQLVSKPFIPCHSIICPVSQDFISGFFHSVWLPPKLN